MFGLVDECLTGAATIGENADVGTPLNRAAEGILVCGDVLEGGGSQVAQARSLIRVAEDAADAAEPRPAEPVGGGRDNAVPPHRVPDLRLGQAMYRPPVVDMAAAARAVSGIGSVGLKRRVGGARSALLSAFSRDDERATAKEAILVPSQGRHYVDL